MQPYGTSSLILDKEMIIMKCRVYLFRDFLATFAWYICMRMTTLQLIMLMTLVFKLNLYTYKPTASHRQMAAVVEYVGSINCSWPASLTCSER